MMNPINVQIAEFVGTSVGSRTKWDRTGNRKLAKQVFVARLIYKDTSGKRRERTKEFLRRRDAEDHIRQLRVQFERSEGRELDADKMTFNDLVDHYEKHYARPAEYAGERKIAGLRSLKPVQGYLRTLRKHFGSLRLKKINYGTLRDFRSVRVQTPVVIERSVKRPLTDAEKLENKTRKRTAVTKVREERPRKVASVNRELTTLRHILAIAETEGWIAKSPFKNGPSLIHASAETVRQRVLTREEETRLLAVCDCDERKQLKAIIICLLDTGIRFGELTTLTWDRVDLARNVINIKALNTKTAKPKTVAITARLRAEITQLWESQSLQDRAGILTNPDLVFGIKNNVKGSWTTARNLAGIPDVRLHDLRHTFGTRLNHLGFSPASIARSLGHQQISTTYRYINADDEMIDAVRLAVENFQVPFSEQSEEDELIN